MLLASYVAGAIILAILPLAFFIARHLAKRSKSLPWSVDDTLLVFSLVRQHHYHGSCIAKSYHSCFYASSWQSSSLARPCLLLVDNPP